MVSLGNKFNNNHEPNRATTPSSQSTTKKSKLQTGQQRLINQNQQIMYPHSSVGLWTLRLALNNGLNFLHYGRCQLRNHIDSFHIFFNLHWRNLEHLETNIMFIATSH